VLVLVESKDRVREDGQAERDRLGEYEFVQLPRAGDLVRVLKGEEAHWVEVRRIEHIPIEYPAPKAEFPAIARREPTLSIVACWADA
jgi:hypothetical protein